MAFPTSSCPDASHRKLASEHANDPVAEHGERTAGIMALAMSRPTIMSCINQISALVLAAVALVGVASNAAAQVPAQGNDQQVRNRLQCLSEGLRRILDGNSPNHDHDRNEFNHEQWWHHTTRLRQWDSRSGCDRSAMLASSLHAGRRGRQGGAGICEQLLVAEYADLARMSCSRGRDGSGIFLDSLGR